MRPVRLGDIHNFACKARGRVNVHLIPLRGWGAELPWGSPTLFQLDTAVNGVVLVAYVAPIGWNEEGLPTAEGDGILVELGCLACQARDQESDRVRVDSLGAAELVVHRLFADAVPATGALSPVLKRPHVTVLGVYVPTARDNEHLQYVRLEQRPVTVRHRSSADVATDGCGVGEHESLFPVKVRRGWLLVTVLML